jgi:hypothetical protein
MSKRKYLVICEKDYCDYIPCVEERIAQAAKVGATLPEQEAWLSELREQEGRFWSSESEWLATLDFQNARV